MGIYHDPLLKRYRSINISIMVKYTYSGIDDDNLGEIVSINFRTYSTNSSLL